MFKEPVIYYMREVEGSWGVRRGGGRSPPPESRWDSRVLGYIYDNDKEDAPNNPEHPPPQTDKQ